MSPEPGPSDSPFPGARSQVPRTREEGSVAPRALPLEISAPTWEPGWTVRLPVRAEHITVAKRVVAYERVTVRTNEIGDLERLESTTRREELQVDVDGEPRVSQVASPGGE